MQQRSIKLQRLHSGQVDIRSVSGVKCIVVIGSKMDEYEDRNSLNLFAGKKIQLFSWPSLGEVSSYTIVFELITMKNWAVCLRGNEPLHLVLWGKSPTGHYIISNIERLETWKP